MRRVLGIVFSPENLLAVGLAILLILIVLFGIDTSPTWIYQGF